MLKVQVENLDALWDIREHHVVEGLHRECVLALRGHTKQTGSPCFT